MNSATEASIGAALLLFLMSTTITSFFIHQYNLIEKVKQYKISNKCIYFIHKSSYAIGFVMLSYNIMLSMIIIYTTVMFGFAIKKYKEYPWTINITKTGYALSVVYYIMIKIMNLSMFEKFSFALRI